MSVRVTHILMHTKKLWVVFGIVATSLIFSYDLFSAIIWAWDNTYSRAIQYIFPRSDNVPVIHDIKFRKSDELLGHKTASVDGDEIDVNIYVPGSTKLVIDGVITNYWSPNYSLDGARRVRPLSLDADIDVGFGGIDPLDFPLDCPIVVSPQGGEFVRIRINLFPISDNMQGKVVVYLRYSLGNGESGILPLIAASPEVLQKTGARVLLPAIGSKRSDDSGGYFDGYTVFQSDSEGRVVGLPWSEVATVQPIDVIWSQQAGVAVAAAYTASSYREFLKIARGVDLIVEEHKRYMSEYKNKTPHNFLVSFESSYDIYREIGRALVKNAALSASDINAIAWSFPQFRDQISSMDRAPDWLISEKSDEIKEDYEYFLRISEADGDAKVDENSGTIGGASSDLHCIAGLPDNNKVYLLTKNWVNKISWGEVGRNVLESDRIFLRVFGSVDSYTRNMIAAEFLHANSSLGYAAYSDANANVRIQIAKRPDIDDDVLDRLAMDNCSSVRAAVAGHPQLSLTSANRLANDQEPAVRVALALSTQLQVTADKLARDQVPAVRKAAAGNRAVSLPVAEQLVGDLDPSVRAAIMMRTDLPGELTNRIVSDVLPSLRKDGRYPSAKECGPDFNSLFEAKVSLDGVSIVRHNLGDEQIQRLAGLPNLNSVSVDAIIETGDCISQRAVAEITTLSEASARKLYDTGDEMVLLSLAINPSTPPEILSLLKKNRSRWISRIAFSNQNYSLLELENIADLQNHTLAAMAESTFDAETDSGSRYSDVPAVQIAHYRLRRERVIARYLLSKRNSESIKKGKGFPRRIVKGTTIDTCNDTNSSE